MTISDRINKNSRPSTRDSGSTLTNNSNTTTSNNNNIVHNNIHNNNRLRSVSPSFSNNSSFIQSNNSLKFQNIRYKGKLPITEIPDLNDLCNEFLRDKNITGLAMLARQAGLPPHLRCKIWPILLKYHPFVQHPYLELDDDDEEEDEEDEEEDDEEEDEGGDNNNDNDSNSNKNNNNNNNHRDKSNESSGSESSSNKKSKDNYKYKIPIKEIKFDLKKYLRSSERYAPSVLTSEIKDMFEIQNKIFDIIEHAIIKFLKKWGKIVHYNPGLTWIALGLAEWVPPLSTSQFVLCGRDDIAKNGTKLRNINDNYFEKFHNLSSSLTSEASSVFESPHIASPKSATPLSSPLQTPPSAFKPMSFAEIYERMVLVILYSPDPETIENYAKDHSTDNKDHINANNSIVDNNNKSTSDNINDNNNNNNGNQNKNTFTAGKTNEFGKLSTLPFTGGLLSDRISLFLFCLRKLLPELHSHLVEEDCLNGDWILWWLKYDGSKVWSRYDRGRTWDLLLGYRTDCQNFEIDMKSLSHLTPDQVRLLGQDLFWNPMDNINEDNNEIDNGNTTLKEKEKEILKEIEDNEDAIDDRYDESFGIEQHDRSLSILTLMSKNRSPSLSIEKTPTLSSISLNSPNTPLLSLSEISNKEIEELPPLDKIDTKVDIPFSKVHPHVEMIFISLAFLKSKEFTITELDQSEIKTLFNRLSSLRTDHTEISSFISNNTEEGDEVNKSNINENQSHNHNHDNDNDHDINNTDGDEDFESLHTNNYKIDGMVPTYVRKSNRDIENVLIEAGELWRKFLYISMVEESELV